MNNIKNISTIVGAALLTSCSTAQSCDDQQWQTLVVGSYTDSGAAGVAVYRFNQANGSFLPLDSVKSSNPSYLAFNDSGDRLYAVNENDHESSAMSSFEFDKSSGKISFINSVATESAAPCYITICGSRALSANYFGGDISIVGIDSTTGALTRLISKQEFMGESNPNESRLHTLMVTPDKRQIIATDLGKDRIYCYDIENILSSSEGETIPYCSYPLSQGMGPRHCAISGDGRYLYVLGELSGEITILERNSGVLEAVSTVVADTLCAGGSADIHISGDGDHLYVTNRLKGDGIVHFAIKDGGRRLERVSFNTTGALPRNFIITPNDKFVLVASQKDDRIDIFSRDLESGILRATALSISIAKPVCLKFAP